MIQRHALLMLPLFLGIMGYSAVAGAFADGQAALPTQANAYKITERGPHHRIWSKVTWETNRSGTVTARTNVAYTELATGLHYLENGRWLESAPLIKPAPGGAVGVNAQHRVTFAANLNTATAIDLVTPDGKRLRSHVLGLGYFDSATGESVLIAQVKDSIGKILPSGTEVVYENAVSNLQADISYVFSKAGLEQNIILRERPPSPAVWGLDPNTTRLEVLTEFVEAPEPRARSTNKSAAKSGSRPQIDAVKAGNKAETAGNDEVLSFGSMQMGPGKAFKLGQGAEVGAGIRVGKEWTELEGRRFLIEFVPSSALRGQLDDLPADRQVRTNASVNVEPLRPSKKRIVPAPQIASLGAETMKIAKESLNEPGYLIDYSLLTGETNDFTFKSDSTYYVSGPFLAEGGTLIFEGGTVLKMATNGSIVIMNGTSSGGQTFFNSEAYRAVIVTAKDDNSVGEVISGSSGTPTGYYGNPAIDFFIYDLDMKDANISYARVGVHLYSDSNFLHLRNLRFQNCETAVRMGGTSLHVQNVLMDNIPKWCFDCEAEDYLFDAQNITAHQCGGLYTNSGPAVGYCIPAFTNCLFVQVTNQNAVVIATNHVTSLSDDTGVFQTVGGGGHYLAPDSPYRNAGTTNISADLLAAIRQKTTYPPIVYSNVIVTADMTFGPQAQRDTDVPDLGYHYDPLDYVLKVFRITNSTVRLLPGTAIGTFGSYGIATWGGGKFISDGAPSTLNHFARWNSVQEGATTNWNGRGNHFVGNWLGGPLAAEMSFRFTDFSMPAKDGCHYESAGSASNLYYARDCQFHGGQISISQYNPWFTNNLFERVSWYLADAYDGLYPVIVNSLFIGGNVYMDDANETPFVFRDNLFDQTIITESDQTAIQGSYNGYTPGSDRILPTNITDVVASIAFQAGPLGGYYQPTNSGFVGLGSTNANLLGLYHHTTQTSQLKETNSIVDIGFHYIALDVNGKPVDTDSDGVPDYLEDLNGNGSVNSGETDWQNAFDPGLKVIITRPVNGALFW